MCRSASGESYLLTYSYVSGDLSPLISRLRDSFHPKGKPFCKNPFALHNKAMSGNNFARPHPSPSATPSTSNGKAMVRDFFIGTYFLKSSLAF